MPTFTCWSAPGSLRNGRSRVVRVIQVYAQGHALAEVSWGIRSQDPAIPPTTSQGSPNPLAGPLSATAVANGRMQYVIGASLCTK